MAKKYRTNINGAPVLNVNFNGAPWTGNLKINGVEVSYDDTPAPQPEPPKPQPDTVWRFSATPVVPTTGGSWWDVFSREGPLRVVLSAGADDKYSGKDCFPWIAVSGNLIRVGAHAAYGNSPSAIHPSPIDPAYLSESQAPQGSNGRWVGEWVGVTSRNAPISGV